MKKACVIGWPISHSRSPLIHGHWLEKYRIDGSYQRIPVEPQRLQEFLAGLPSSGFEGCNVTLPHKEGAFACVTPADETTRRLGVVNTIFCRDRELLGTNTDGEGFINSLSAGAPGVVFQDRRAVILGAGGATMSVADALIAQGMGEIVVVNRSREKAEALRLRFGNVIKVHPWEARSDILTDCDLLVNTTSLGMRGQPELEIDLQRLPNKAVVTDIVYVPLRTPLLLRAAERGNPIVEGLGMLLHQAVRGFELWFGTRPEVTEELYALVARDIDPKFAK